MSIRVGLEELIRLRGPFQLDSIFAFVPFTLLTARVERHRLRAFTSIERVTYSLVSFITIASPSSLLLLPSLMLLLVAIHIRLKNTMID
jgi:hypothetical protein